MSTQNASLLFGIVFILTGILGFVPNPLIAPQGVFAVNLAHNLVHVGTGFIFVVAALRYAGKTVLVFKAIGSAYVVVTIAGFLTSGNMLLGLVHINDADRWLHLGLAVVILATGFVLPSQRAVTT